MSRIAAIIALAALAAAPAAHADETTDALRASIRDADPNFRIDEIRPTAADGLYEVISGANIFYMTGDGQFLLRGDLIDLEAKRNITAERRRQLVHRVVEEVGEDSMLVYEPEKGPAKHSITVFTDTTCPYCQRLHVGLMELIEQYPVKVRYLMFPRAGLGATSADTLRDIWCAADPQQAMTDAKAGRSVAPRGEDCTTPISEHFRVAQQIGVRGTPYLLIDDGPIVPGYRKNSELLHMMGLNPHGSASGG